MDTLILFRIKIYLVIVPSIVSWVWGGGWLYQLGFKDYGGSGCIHLTGGTIGIACSLILGPRLGLINDFFITKELRVNQKLEKLNL